MPREDIPSNRLSEYKANGSVENVFIEINLQSKKRLLSCPYNPNLILLNNHIQNKSRGLDFYLSKYDNFVVLAYFNAAVLNTTISEFVRHITSKTLGATNFKNHASTTNLVLILSWQIGQNVFKTQMILKLNYPISINWPLLFWKLTLRNKNQRWANIEITKKFDINLFRNDILNELLSKNVHFKDTHKEKAP